MSKNSNLSANRSIIGSIPINYKIFKFQIYIILASIIFIKTAYIFVAYIFGYGMYTTDKGYVPMLSYVTFLVFANLLALGIIMFKKNINIIMKIILLTSIILTGLIVILSLSRIDWGIYGIGLLTLTLVLPFRKRISLPFFLGFIVIVVFIFPFPTEIQSVKMRYTQAVIGIMNPQITTSSGQHLLDILDAIDIIKLNPILGIGVGGAYKTILTQEWKIVSYGVHNGFLNTWIKFGVLAAIAYLSMFFNFLKTGHRFLRIPSEKVKILVSPAFGTGLGMHMGYVFFIFSEPL